MTDDVWVAVTVSAGAAACPAHAGAEETEERPAMSAYLFGVADNVDAMLAPQEHSRAVGRWARALAREVGLDEVAVRRCELGGRLHDIGKIVIPESILAKPGPLSDGEWEQVRRHSEAGALLARAAPTVASVADVIAQHHERYDGLGYPAGLVGDEILVEARVVALCDAWAAMRTDRAYRSAMTAEEARRRVVLDRGTHFDPKLADAFLALVDRGALGELRPIRPPAD